MSHYHTYQEQGLVLRGFNFGESNKYFYIFTENLGLIRASAQNIRSNSSKLKYGLQDLSFSNFVFIKTKSFWKITNVDPIKNYYYLLKEDKEKLNVLTKNIFLLEKMVGEEEKNTELFFIFKESFDFMETLSCEDEKVHSFELVFLLRIMKKLGYLDHKNGKFKRFLNSEWNTGLLEEVKPFRSEIISEINKSIKESQLITTFN